VGLIIPRDVTCAIFCSNESDAALLLFPFFLYLDHISFYLSVSFTCEIISRSLDREISREFPSAYHLHSSSSSFSVIVTRGGILLAQMTMSLSCTTLHVVLPLASYSRSCRTKSGRREWHGGKAGEEAHWERTAWQCTRAREQPSLTELLPLRSLHSREAVVYAPRHPTDAELMILINVS